MHSAWTANVRESGREYGRVFPGEGETVKKVLVINGHPRAGSYCDALTNAYLEGARTATAILKSIVVRDLKFDPNLPNAHYILPPMEPDLAEATETIRWANHLALIYPVWWGGMPAMLKGFIDRVFLPEFAYRIMDQPPFWVPLLTGKSADVLMTMDTPPALFRVQFGNCAQYAAKKVVLEMSGFKPVRVMTVGPVVPATDARRRRWLAQARALAARLG
jgi:putative NADPH-quinone reductase